MCLLQQQDVFPKHNTGQEPTTLILLHFSSSTKVTFDHVNIRKMPCLWSRHFGMVPTNSRARV